MTQTRCERLRRRPASRPNCKAEARTCRRTHLLLRAYARSQHSDRASPVHRRPRDARASATTRCLGRQGRAIGLCCAQVTRCWVRKPLRNKESVGAPVQQGRRAAPAVPAACRGSAAPACVASSFLARLLQLYVHSSTPMRNLQARPDFMISPSSQQAHSIPEPADWRLAFLSCCMVRGMCV